jgi:hypothetical protein
MEPLTERQIRSSLINATRSEAAALALPPWSPLAAPSAGPRRTWAELEFLGWRDPKAPQRGYLVTWRQEAPVGVILRAADSAMSRRIKAMCLLCQSTHSADLISLFTARRAGARGRNGDTVGTYICADLDCSNAIRAPAGAAQFSGPTRRMPPPPPQVIADRAAGLSQRLAGFMTSVVVN